MEPVFRSAQKGIRSIAGQRFDCDALFHLSVQVEQRKKRLSKPIYGSLHVISLDEARHIYQKGAAHYFESKGCRVELFPTPKTIEAWNEAKGAVIGLFHVTC